MALQSGHDAPAINRFFCLTTFFLWFELLSFYRITSLVDTLDKSIKFYVMIAPT
jgi:hypothetical protein